MAVVEAENLGKTYYPGEIEVEALRDVTFDVDPASFVSFIGPSGSGKTTLLNIIGCLDSPTAGSISVLSEDVTSLSRKERTTFRGENIGFIFQDFNLIPVLTVYENVEYPLLMVQSVSKSEREETVMKLLEQVGLEEQRDKLPSQISGGQKQRVAIARSLTTGPELVLADEPTGNLDHDTAYEILSLMDDIKQETGASFLFSTHDYKVVDQADHVFILEDGQIVDDREVDEEESFGKESEYV